MGKREGLRVGSLDLPLPPAWAYDQSRLPDLCAGREWAQSIVYKGPFLREGAQSVCAQLLIVAVAECQAFIVFSLFCLIADASF